MWTPVERDDADGVVAHLLENGDVSRSLENLKPVVVGRRQHGGAFVPPDETPLLQGTGFVAVERLLSDVFDEEAARSRTVGFAPLRFRCERRNPSIRRIDDERGSP